MAIRRLPGLCVRAIGLILTIGFAVKSLRPREVDLIFELKIAVLSLDDHHTVFNELRDDPPHRSFRQYRSVRHGADRWVATAAVIQCEAGEGEEDKLLRVRQPVVETRDFTLDDPTHQRPPSRLIPELPYLGAPGVPALGAAQREQL